MKFRTFILGAAFALLLAPVLHCQSDSMIHVNQFPGITVGTKVASAMQHCPAAPVPCMLVIDGSLAAAATGNMPALCGNCTLVDYRQGVPGAGGPVQAPSLNGAKLTNDSGKSNLGLGVQALALDTGTLVTAFGSAALEQNTGSNNSAFGGNALIQNSSGGANTAIGTYSGFSNTTGSSNTSIGTYSFYCGTTGNNNTAVGTDALQGGYVSSCPSSPQNTSNNTAVGNGALYNDSTGSDNTGIGQGALYNISSGSFNTALGFNAGQYINGAGANVSSSNSVYLGAGSQAGASGNTNEIVIGYNAVGIGSNTVTLGNGFITQTNLRGTVLIDMQSTPPTPTAFKGSLYVSNGTGQLGCVSNTGGSCLNSPVSGQMTGTGTTATHTFSTAFSATPLCTASPDTSVGTWFISATSATALTITYTTSAASTWDVICTGSLGVW